MIRLFVAIELPLDVRERLHALGGGVPDGRWQNLNKLHLTLRFVGEVPEDLASDVVAELSGIRSPAFDLTLNDVGCFGEGKHTRILWAGVEANPQLMALKTKIDNALAHAGCEADRRHKFVPHITIAHLRHPPADSVIHWLQAGAGFHAGPLHIDRFTLYSSDKRNYTREQEFMLLPAG